MTLGSLVVQDLTYTCRQLGDAVVLNYLNSDSLSVSVSGHTINVNIVSGVTTATQIKALLDADLDVMYLVSIVVSGTGSNAQVTCKNALIANGVLSAVKASQIIGTLKYTAQTAGAAGNSIRIKYTSGSLLVSVSTNDITIRFVDGITTASAIKAAVAASGPANTLVSVVSSGAALTVPQYTASALSFTNLVGGLDATPGSVVVQDLTYSTDSNTDAYNGKSISYTTGATAGAEVVTVDGSNNVSVQIQNGVSTATQIKTACDASQDFNGIKADGTVYSLGFASLKGTSATGTITIVDYTGLTGSTVTVAGQTVTEGVEWFAGTDNDTTAGTLMDAINTACDTVILVTGGYTGSVLTLTVIATGVAGNSHGIAKSASDSYITISGSTFSGGLNGATLTVAGHPLVESVDWIAEVNDYTTAAHLSTVINALSEVDTVYSFTDGVLIVAATPGIAGNSITLATSDPVNMPISGPTLTGGTNKYACTVSGTGSNAQKTVNGLQTAGAVGQGANAIYKDQSITALTSSYVYVNFHFHANNLTLINDETTGNKTISLSWDGVNTHGVLTAGQSLGWDLQTTVTGIWLKYINAAPNYRLNVLGS